MFTSNDAELDSCVFSDVKMTYSTSPSPKRSRRAVQKRLVSIPIKDIQGGSRLKGETAPPSDSWAWRKYGQKPIKGSPYPRGYYRCSSSKGCPARKQVERSRSDPSMLLITYSSDHNHPWPASRSSHHHHPSTLPELVPKFEPELEPNQPEQEQQEEDEQQDKFAEQPMVVTAGDDFRWFGDMDTMTSSLLHSPVFAEDVKVAGSGSEAVYFPMREEDESLFADLGELPECSVVFRRGPLEREEERRRCAAAPWCGTTG